MYTIQRTGEVQYFRENFWTTCYFLLSSNKIDENTKKSNSIDVNTVKWHEMYVWIASQSCQPLIDLHAVCRCTPLVVNMCSLAFCDTLVGSLLNWEIDPASWMVELDKSIVGGTKCKLGLYLLVFHSHFRYLFQKMFRK